MIFHHHFGDVFHSTGPFDLMGKKKEEKKIAGIKK
jgi:hypothetical protein